MRGRANNSSSLLFSLLFFSFSLSLHSLLTLPFWRQPVCYQPQDSSCGVAACCCWSPSGDRADGVARGGGGRKGWPIILQLIALLGVFYLLSGGLELTVLYLGEIQVIEGEEPQSEAPFCTLVRAEILSNRILFCRVVPPPGSPSRNSLGPDSCSVASSLRKRFTPSRGPASQSPACPPVGCRGWGLSIPHHPHRPWGGGREG